MTANELFESTVRSRGDLAGVFEYDGESACFYLYNVSVEMNHGAVGAIRTLSGRPDFSQREIAVRWNEREDKVGLFIHGRLWAVLDGERAVGGNYAPGGRSPIEDEEMLGLQNS